MKLETMKFAEEALLKALSLMHVARAEVQQTARVYSEQARPELARSISVAITEGQTALLWLREADSRLPEQ